MVKIEKLEYHSIGRREQESSKTVLERMLFDSRCSRGAIGEGKTSICLAIIDEAEVAMTKL